MCVIVHKPAGIDLDKPLVEKLWNANKDGAGVLFKPANGKWQSTKGIMTLNKLLEMGEIFEKNTELVLHCRIKTKGDVCEEHTHPFDWSRGKTRRVLFHNGTLKLFNPGPEDSDSSMLAKLITNFTTEEACNYLKSLSSAGFGRFVIFDGSKVQIFGDSESIEKDGLWFSNKRHIDTVTKYPNNWTAPSQTHSYPKNQSSGGASGYADLGLNRIADNPNRTTLISKSVEHCAKIDKVQCSDSYKTSCIERNAMLFFPTASLEAVVKIIELNPDIDDPFIEYVKAFKN